MCLARSRLVGFSKLALVTLATLLLTTTPAQACTIFVLTDGVRALFFNNEDWLNCQAAIGAVNGKLHVAKRVFGRGRVALDAGAQNRRAMVDGGRRLFCEFRVQPGDGGREYSSVHDLDNGTIIIFPTPDRDERVTLDLARGGHYYDISQIANNSVPQLARYSRTCAGSISTTFNRWPNRTPAIIARLEAASGEWRLRPTAC